MKSRLYFLLTRLIFLARKLLLRYLLQLILPKLLNLILALILLCKRFPATLPLQIHKLMFLRVSLAYRQTLVQATTIIMVEIGFSTPFMVVTRTSLVVVAAAEVATSMCSIIFVTNMTWLLSAIIGMMTIMFSLNQWITPTNTPIRINLRLQPNQYHSQNPNSYPSQQSNQSQYISTHLSLNTTTNQHLFNILHKHI